MSLTLKQQQAHPKYPARGTLERPVYFTHPIVVQNVISPENPKGWADPFWDDMSEKQRIGILSRVPMIGPFEDRQLFDISGKDGLGHDSTYSGPLNPKSLTGMIGRGLLGKYGPNYAADPIVTRFNEGSLEMVAIQRADTGEWAIPGGMVNAGDTVSTTLRNEFNEEALGNTLGTGDEEYASGEHDCSKVKSKEDSDYVAKIAALQGEVDKLFNGGTKVYEGLVDDPRNTDWAWMSTVAVHYHIDNDSPLHNIELRPATDATGAKWYKLEKPEDFKRLYASHGEFVMSAIKKKAETDKMWSDAFLNLVV
jgi:ADP-ribose pyrophosphatase